MMVYVHKYCNCLHYTTDHNKVLFVEVSVMQRYIQLFRPLCHETPDVGHMHWFGNCEGRLMYRKTLMSGSFDVPEDVNGRVL